MTIEQRLERLERQNRWLKCGVASLVLAVLVAGIVGATGQERVPDLVKAKAFHVVGKDGKVAHIIGVGKDNKVKSGDHGKQILEILAKLKIEKARRALGAQKRVPLMRPRSANTIKASSHVWTAQTGRIHERTRR